MKRVLALSTIIALLGMTTMATNIQSGGAQPQDGVHKEYYESGTLRAEGNFKDGQLNGIAKLYYESGALKGEINYKDGKPEGNEKRYDENGTLRSERTYKSGELITKKDYDESGNLISEEP